MKKYFITAKMSAQTQTHAGLMYLLPNYALKAVYLVPLLMLWRILMAKGVMVGMTTGQMLTYTFVSALLGDLLVVQSPLTGWLYEGLIASLYQRPMTIMGHVVAQTLGGCVPSLLFFSLPAVLLSPLFGVSAAPVSLWFFPSLILCVSLGFAIDFLFAYLLIRMMNARWLAISIRSAVIWLFSGSFIPFAVLPWGLGDLLAYLPFGSLSGATLAVYTGLADPIKTLFVQLCWNVLLWPLAIICYKNSQEKLVSNGG